jgi:glycosyltransferase involved in cell wall biosynthesis
MSLLFKDKDAFEPFTPEIWEYRGVIAMIIPCKNEAGNISRIFQGLGEFDDIDEFIFVEGGSTDGTQKVIEDLIQTSKLSNIKLIQQSAKGKFNAIRDAVSFSTASHFVIWDADLAINIEDQKLLISVYLLQPSRPKFVTANRLNPQIEESAMRRLNLYGNHFFSKFNYIVSRINIPDVLAGTKIFPREVLLGPDQCPKAIKLDPFGDLYLLSRASKLSLHVLSLNCEYKSRNYGETKIRRWSGGLSMLHFLLHLQIHKCHYPREIMKS